MEFIKLYESAKVLEGVKKVFSPTKDCPQFQIFFTNGAKLDCNESSLTIYPKRGSTEKAKKVKIEDAAIDDIIKFCEL